MPHYIDKDALVAEIERRIESCAKQREDMLNVQCHTLADDASARMGELRCFQDFLDTIEVKEVDLELITGWFDHIAQIADDRMTLTNQRMTDAHALDEIKCLAKNSSEFITEHYKAQKGEKA